MKPVVLRDDRGLRFFLRQNDDPRRPGTPICVTIMHKKFLSQDESFVSAQREQLRSQDVSFVPNTQQPQHCLSQREQLHSQDVSFVPNTQRPQHCGIKLPSNDEIIHEPIPFDEHDKEIFDNDGDDDYEENLCIDEFGLQNDGVESPLLRGGNLVGEPPINNNIGSNSIGTSNFVGSNSSWGGKVAVGQIYSDKKELQKHIPKHAIGKNFQFRIIKSTKTLCAIQCAAIGCGWRMRSIRVKFSYLFTVTMFHDNHTCSLEFINQSHQQASEQVIGECIKSKYNGIGHVYRPKDVIHDVRQEFGVNISYHKTWRAREAALNLLRGMLEESFTYLPHYCAELEKNNPGTVTCIESGHDNNFKYLFIALRASLRGFRSAMRPVIAVDGTHLKGKYMGTLFVAAAQDGNNNIYLLPFGIGDSENNASWEWFLEKLLVALALEDFSQLEVISDRHKSIDRAVSLVLPESYHGHCMHHIKQNMKVKKIYDSVILIYFKAAKAYRIEDFDRLMT